MKLLTILAILLVSAQASAGKYQNEFCGTDIAAVKVAIDQMKAKYGSAMKGRRGHADKFVATWYNQAPGKEKLYVSIAYGQTFAIGEKRDGFFRVCPQLDGTFFAEGKAPWGYDSGHAGIFYIDRSGKMQFTGWGQMGEVQGTYAKSPSKSGGNL